MNLFKFFKRETSTPFVVDKNKTGIELLNDGILFEDTGDFLQWGSDIESDKKYIKKEYRTDRTIYEWGERTILMGLQLTLSTIIWKQKDDGSDVPFIEFSAMKEDAEKYFNIILSHLEKILGPPKAIEGQQGRLLVWKVGIIRITLNLFEQYHMDKLHFIIEK